MLAWTVYKILSHKINKINKMEEREKEKLNCGFQDNLQPKTDEERNIETKMRMKDTAGEKTEEWGRKREERRDNVQKRKKDESL